MKITCLGTGSAYRTPTMGGFWGKCNPDDERNKRLCQSLLIEQGNTRLLIDAGPDIRQQSIKYKIDDIDAVLVTHAHYDHFFGLPELEVLHLVYKKSIPVYAHPETWAHIKPCVSWLLSTKEQKKTIDPESFGYLELLTIKDIDLITLAQNHGDIKSTGIRIGDFAYTTDVNSFPEESWDALKGIKTWILECDSIEPSQNHNNIRQALQWIETLRPQTTYLTHIHPYVDHERLESMLPQNVHVAYDGMEIEL